MNRNYKEINGELWVSYRVVSRLCYKTEDEVLAAVGEMPYKYRTKNILKADIDKVSIDMSIAVLSHFSFVESDKKCIEVVSKLMKRGGILAHFGRDLKLGPEKMPAFILKYS
jgi:hypothetical protein